VGTDDGYAGLLIDRLAATIIDDSLPLKEVERDLRGSVAEVAVKKRGLAKRETASRCGVTEKSIENYLKEARNNPKSPEREVARAVQDEMLTLEEIYERVAPVLRHSRDFTLDDAKRSLDKLIRTGEVREYPGHEYRAVDRPSIRYPNTPEAHRELVDQKARDLDYVVLRQKEATESDLERRGQRYSRVVGDSNLVRIDFTVDVAPDQLPQFYEKLSESIAKITMKLEKKKGTSRVRLVFAMRSVVCTMLALALLFLPVPTLDAPTAAAEERPDGRSWELDRLPPAQVDAPPVRRGAGERVVEIRNGGPDEEEPGGEPAGEDPDGEDPDGEDPDGEDPDGEDPDGDSGGGGVVFIGPGDREGIDGNPFLRGDVNVDERVDVTDIVFLLNYLRGFLDEVPCEDGADVDDSGRIDVADAVELFSFLFLGRVDAIELRYAPDMTEDALGCGTAAN